MLKPPLDIRAVYFENVFSSLHLFLLDADSADGWRAG